MARKQREGIDYFPVDVNLFTDIKFRKAIMKYGGVVHTVYLAMLSKIYADKGYYALYDGDNKDDFIFSVCESLRDIPGVTYDTLPEMIDCFVQSGLFDRESYNNGILTSKRIQMEYFNATYRRKTVNIRPSIWLVPIKDMEALSTSASITTQMRAYLGISDSDVPKYSSSVPEYSSDVPEYTDNTTVDNTTVDNTTVDNTTVDNTTVDNTTPDNTTPDNTTPDNTGPEQITKNNITLHQSTADNSRPDNTRVDDTRVDDATTPFQALQELCSGAELTETELSRNSETVKIIEFEDKYLRKADEKSRNSTKAGDEKVDFWENYQKQAYASQQICENMEQTSNVSESNTSDTIITDTTAVFATIEQCIGANLDTSMRKWLQTVLDSGVEVGVLSYVARMTACKKPVNAAAYFRKVVQNLVISKVKKVTELPVLDVV